MGGLMKKNLKLRNLFKSFCLLGIVFLLLGCGQTKEELLEQGTQLYEQGNFRGAIVLYKNALEKDANYLEARTELANSYLATGRYAKAKNEYQKVLHQNPASVELLLKLTRVYLGQKNTAEALLALDEYHSSMPETAESLTLYGQAHGSVGDIDSAAKFFKKALQLQPDSIPARLNLAKVYLQYKKFTEARQLLETIIAQDENFVEAYYLLARIETRDGKKNAALKVYQALVAVQPQQLRALYMIGLFQMEQGQLSEAQKSVDLLLSRFKDRPEGQRLKGLLLYQQGKFKDAVQTFTASIKQQPHPLAYFFTGLSHFRQNQLELALNNFQKTLDLNPEFERARVLVAMTLFKQKRIDDAVTEIQKVLHASPDNAYAHNILGSAYLAKGQFDEGMAELEKATEIDPGLVDAHLKRGIFHLAKGENIQGEADLVKAVTAAPKVLNSRLMLVMHYLKQKNYSSAIDLLQAGMDGSPTDALLNNYLAAAYFSQKKPDQALLALQRSKEANPEYLTPYFNLASYYASNADYQKSLAEYQAVLERDTKNIKALLGMVAIYNLQGLTAETEKIYQRLEATELEEGFVAAAAYQFKRDKFKEVGRIITRGMELHQTSVALIELQGGLSVRLKQFEKAKSNFIRLASLSPERGHQLLLRLYLSTNQQGEAEKLIKDLLQSTADKDYTYLMAASLALSRKQSEEAISLLMQGINRVENKLRLQMKLARIYQANGNILKAEQTYQRILETAPRFAQAYAALGMINEQRGEKGKARDLYRSTLQYDSKNVFALNNLAYLLIDNFGQEKEALDLAMRAYRSQPADPRIMDTLGYILLKSNRADEAVTMLSHAVEQLPDDATVKLHLAMANLGASDKETARNLLLQVVDTGGAQDVKQARIMLKEL